MTSSVIDAMLIVMRILEYYQIADNAPFTSNAIERFHHGCGLFLLLAVATVFYMLKVPSWES